MYTIYLPDYMFLQSITTATATDLTIVICEHGQMESHKRCNSLEQLHDSKALRETQNSKNDPNQPEQNPKNRCTTYVRIADTSQVHQNKQMAIYSSHVTDCSKFRVSPSAVKP